MGLMATLHEGCLQVYICSRDGQLETKKKNLKSPVPHLRENASAKIGESCYLGMARCRESSSKVLGMQKKLTNFI